MFHKGRSKSILRKNYLPLKESEIVLSKISLKNKYEMGDSDKTGVDVSPGIIKLHLDSELYFQQIYIYI